MLAGRYNLTHDAGSTLSRTFALTLASAPVNLAGYRARMQVRDTWLPTGTVYAAFGTTSPDSGITIPTPSNGRIVLGPIDRTDLADIPPGTVCVWDLFIYVPSGEEIRVLYGTFTLKPIATEVP